MRNFTCIMLCATLLTASCKKSGNITEDGGCIEQLVIPVRAHSISATEVAIADQLFQANGISNTNLRYYQYRQDTLQTLSMAGDNKKQRASFGQWYTVLEKIAQRLTQIHVQ